MSGARKHHASAMGIAMKAPGLKPEYIEACRVLSDETMTKACSLLLSENENETDEQAEAEQTQLLELYEKCRLAAAVVEREAPTTTLPSLPVPSRLPAARAGVLARPMSMSKAATKSTMPNRRMSRIAPPPMGKRMMMQRQTSESSMNSINSMNSLDAKHRGHPMNKKMRPARPGSPTANENPASEPPQSALKFLARLNNEKRNSPRNSSPPRKRDPSTSTAATRTDTPGEKSVELSTPSKRRQSGPTQPSRSPSKRSNTSQTPPTCTQPSRKKSSRSPTNEAPPANEDEDEESSKSTSSSEESSGEVIPTTESPTRVQPSRGSRVQPSRASKK